MKWFLPAAFKHEPKELSLSEQIRVLK